MDVPQTPSEGTYLPDDEFLRLMELRRLLILDTPPDECFDRVCSLVARTLNVPTVVISLVDESREWFKARVGMPASQAAREGSFAAQVVSECMPLTVRDALPDPRFVNGELVNSTPHIRACLAVPLFISNQQAVGALCAMDVVPRDFSAAELAVLSDFGSIVAGLIRNHARLAALEDTSNLVDSEIRHREFERRMTTITNSIPALIGYWNTDLRCEFANDAYRQLFGLTPEQMLGMHIRDVIGKDLYRLNEPHAEAALAGQAQRFQRRIFKGDGTPADTEGQYLPDRDEHGHVRGFFVLVTDVTELTVARDELEVSNAKLLKESTTDFLTGLANRRVFSERCEAAASQYKQTGAAYALILLDLDDFKLINDEFGHDIGDEVLRAVGKILGNELRGQDDLAARLGGEEFAVLCFGDFTPGTLHELAERIRSQIHKTTVPAPQGAVSFTSSFGIACSHADDSGWKHIFARADVALYQAKTSGKDCVQFGGAKVPGATGRFRSVRPASPG